MSEALAAEALTTAESPWEVPFGFSTYELTQDIRGPIFGSDGQGVEVVRPGDRDIYSASGYYMSIESLAGTPGQQFSNVHAALKAASDELFRWPHYRHALSNARACSASPQ